MDGSAFCHCLALKRAARRVGRIYDRHLADAGLTTAQFSILVALLEGQPLTMARLAERMEMDRTTLVRALKPLQRDRLLRSKADAADARRLVMELTADGKKKIATAGPLWRRAQSEIEDMIGTRRAASLRSELQSIIGGVS